jgi:hypothetical protein
MAVMAASSGIARKSKSAAQPASHMNTIRQFVLNWRKFSKQKIIDGQCAPAFLQFTEIPGSRSSSIGERWLLPLQKFL